MLFSDNKKYGSFENHPLYKELCKIAAKNETAALTVPVFPGPTESRINPSTEPKGVELTNNEKILEEKKVSIVGEEKEPPASEPAPKVGNVCEDEDKIDEEAMKIKKQRKCDEILAEYLDSIAKVVHEDYYRRAMKFVFLFRECLNHYGDRLIKLRQSQGLGAPPDPVVDESSKTKEYCLSNTAEQAPEISNEFVTVYLDELKSGFDRSESIDLTQNLCFWLHNNGYTCSKLSLIQDSLT